EDWLHLNIRHDRGDFLIGKSTISEVCELETPKSPFCCEAFVGFAQSPHAASSVFLHQIEELKCDGVDEPQLRRKFCGVCVGNRRFAPREMRGEVGMAEFLEDFLKTIDQEPQIAVDLIESESDVVWYVSALHVFHFPVAGVLAHERGGVQGKGKFRPRRRAKRKGRLN